MVAEAALVVKECLEELEEDLLLMYLSDDSSSFLNLPDECLNSHTGNLEGAETAVRSPQDDGLVLEEELLGSLTLWKPYMCN